MKKKCIYCQENRLPSYLEAEQLKKFLTQRGKIVSRERSNLCAQHQRKLAREIKKARVLALLPFVIYES